MLKSKYLRRIIIYSMILVTIPVLSLGILSYFKAKGIIQEKVNMGNMQVLTQTELKVEQVLQTIDNAIIQFINTPIVGESIRMSFEPKDFLMVQQLSGGLYKLQTYDLGISNVWMSSFIHKWYLDNSGFSHSLSDEFMKSLTAMMQYPEISKWVTNDGSSNILLVKKLPIHTFKDFEGIIVATVPNYKLQKLIPEFNGDSDTIVFDADYRMLTKVSNPDFTQDKIEQVIEHLQSSGEDSGSSEIRLNDGSIGVTYKKSAFNGWVYVSLVSIEQITKESTAIGWYTVYICSAVFVILLALSWVGSNKIYLPIRQIFESAVGDNRTDGEDELQVIGKHIHTLRTSQSKLLDQIQGQTKQLEEFFIRKLLLGELGAKEIQEKTEQFHYDLSLESFCVLTVQIDTLNGTRFQENDHDLLMFAVNNIVSELIIPGSRLEPVVVGGNQVTIVRNKAATPEAGKNDVYSLSELVQTTVKEILELRISIGISRFYTNLTMGAQAYQECLEALKYRIRFGEEAILHVEDVLPDRRIHTIFPEWIEKQLIDALKTPDLEKAGQLLHEFLSVTLRDNIRHQEYQMILFRLLSDLIREIQHAGENQLASSQEDHQLFEQLFKLRTIAETEEWFMKMVMEPMVVLLNKRWETQNRNISELMMEIIHDEYETDLTLDLCAARLNYHPNYLKTVFRKETGVNFSDYLSQYRLNKAKKWLMETDMKVSEIAEKLRYQNSQNFIRYFRKMEDMTPGDYRKKYLNGSIR
ncbi:helix-turn-helix domain-containing protein [Paenibacillus agricola]|uniref:Helix-turn-helix transcriptional regulator n=1 Tax=Paenibacillus agricola TaxID=2716264 RepID=A0ABX0IYA0_9BACL|nr:helix-turn-helix domain-containing protein [Paenibacillus agricola]NHN28934.1 helix-turn-helix transcriptional regulator [Paenibacillus agricola]